MADVRPFRALRPIPAAAARVASVPYDVCDTAEARALADGNPDSFLHVTRAEIDMTDDVDPHSPEVYTQGRANLDALRARGVLVREERPCLYLYRLVMGAHVQTGLVGTFSVEEYDDGRIVKHEHTRPDKEQDRTTHILTLGAQTGPVFLTYRPSAQVDALAAEVQKTPPLFDFTAVDGIRHTLWRLDEPGPFVDAFSRVTPLYVADGHHRSAAASNVRRLRREAGRLTAADPQNHFMAVAFPADQVKILAYNRLVHDLGGRSPDEFLEALRAVCEVTASGAAEPAGPEEVCLYLQGAWHSLRLVPHADASPVDRLTPQMLQERVLGPLLGITDPRKDKRISFVGGIRGTAELVRRVDAGQARAAFSLPPVTTEQLLSVADAGSTMPPKSTWFEPKLRSGMFIYLMEEGRA